MSRERELWRYADQWTFATALGAQVAQWLELRPDVQYVYQPGGLRHTTDDVIVGLRLSIIL